MHNLEFKREAIENRTTKFEKETINHLPEMKNLKRITKFRLAAKVH